MQMFNNVAIKKKKKAAKRKKSKPEHANQADTKPWNADDIKCR